jgi:transcriptional antiterminator
VNDNTYLSERELAALLKVSTRTVQRWRANGEGPPWTRISVRTVRYNLKSCNDWAKLRTFNHHAQELSVSKR